MKKYGSLLGLLLVFALAAYVMVLVYDKGKDEKPLRYANVPQETIDWLNSLRGGVDDLLASFSLNPRPGPWNNDDDFGKDSLTGLRTLEDNYFVFYFPDSLTHSARLCQGFAHEAIPHMKDLLGKYYYPKDMNGRKVPVYLLSDQENYDSLIHRFSPRANAASAGITIYEISPSGFYLYAIALNGNYVFSDEEYTKVVLWHEMTHYCFFASIDYNQHINLPMWCYEGIAEYAAMPGQYPSFTSEEIASIRRECTLSTPKFPQTFENYRGGQSIFCFLEQRYGKESVKSFLQVLYASGLSEALRACFELGTEELEREWKESLR
jgi:hypothetical protein